MDRTGVIVLALLLLVASVATAAGHGQPTARPERAADATDASPAVGPDGRPALAVAPTAVPNTTAYLAIPADRRERRSVGTASLDVAGSMALSADRIQGRLTTLALDERLASADDAAARRAVLEEAAATLDRRAETLSVEQTRLVGRYANGTLSDRAFLTGLARIHARADRLSRSATELEQSARSVPGADGVVNRAKNLELSFSSFDGPVRDRLAAALAGEAGAFPVAIETSTDGVVLAAVAGSEYLREAYLAGERDPTASSGPSDINGALTRVTDLYPWAWAHSSVTNNRGGHLAGIYRFTIFHSQGRLTTFLDEGTGNVFAEFQRKHLSELPTTARTNATGDLALTVNRTHPTGPLRVELADANTSEPVDGTVTLDGQPVGRTGADGVLWTVSPRETVTVAATSENRTVTLTTGATA